MSDIEKRIDEWKNDLSQAESLAPSDVAELESHLRESIGNLQRLGLSDREAFLLATDRLGKNDHLRCEFRKVNGDYVWPRRLFWMLLGFVLFSIVEGTIGSVSMLGTAATAAAVTNSTVLVAVSSVLWCLGWICVVLFALWFCRHPLGGRLPSLSIVFGIFVAAVLLSKAVDMAGRVILFRFTTAEVAGQLAMAGAYTGLVSQLLLPIGLLGVAVVLKRHARVSI